MRSSSKLLIIIFLVHSVNSFSQDIFSNLYNTSGPQFTWAHDIIRASGGGYIIAGQLQWNGLVTKTDSAGNVQWSRQIGNFPYAIANFKSVTYSADDYILGGTGVFGLAQDMCFVKIDQMGDTVWSRHQTFGTTAGGDVHHVASTTDNGCVFAGKYYSSGPPYSSILVGKIDGSGNLAWTRRLTPYNWNNEGRAARQMPDGGVMLCSMLENSSSPGNYSFDMMLTKFAADGTLVWSKTYNKPTKVLISPVDMLISDNAIFSFFAIDNGYGILKTDLSGNVLWDKEYISTHNPYGSYWDAQFSKTKDGGFVCLGSYNTDTFLSKLFKVDSIGNLEWARESDVMGRDVAVSSDSSGYIAIGNSGAYNYFFSLVSFDSLGIGIGCDSVDTVSVSPVNLLATPNSPPTISAGGYSAYHPPIYNITLPMTSMCSIEMGIGDSEKAIEVSVFPNPGNGIFQVRSKVRIGRYVLSDMLGRVIRSGMPGESGFEIDISTIASGLYSLQLITRSGEVVTRKLIKE